jgi:hypothetical protein
MEDNRMNNKMDINTILIYVSFFLKISIIMAIGNIYPLFANYH